MSTRLLSSQRIVAPVIALIALAVYVLTLSPGAYPGESAGLIAYHTGLDPFDTLLQPVWGVLIRLLALLPLPNLAVSLNLFSALCAALSVGLLFRLTSSIPHDKTPEESRASFSATRAQLLSGIAAALFFAFSIPFWTVATRAHYLTFEALFILSCTWLFFNVWTWKSRRALYAFAFLYGLGMVQSAAFILASPIFLVALFFRLWQRDMLSAKMLFTIAAWTLVGFAMIIPAALRFYGSPAYEWREIDHFVELLWILMRDQGRTALSAVRQVGWMLILLINILPWFVVVAFAKKTSNDRTSRIGSFLLHLVVTVLGVILLFNITPSPLTVIADGTQLVFPYLVSAIWFGYIAGYWYVMAANLTRGRDAAKWLKPVKTTWSVAILLTLGVAAVLNMPRADGRGSAAPILMAEAIVESMGERDWLLSNGLLDANIYVAAAQQGKSITILNPRLSGIRPYRLYMAAQMGDPRLQGLAQLGLGPLLSEWLETDPNIEQRLAILSSPEIWVDAGFYPVPEVTLFGGQRTAEPPDTEQYMVRHRSFWEALLDKPSLADEHPSGMYHRWLRAHASKVANNAGVFLEDSGFLDEAYESYTTAIQLDRDNISARMNQLSLAIRTERPEADELNEAFDDFIARREGRINLWALSANYGYVRDPQAYVQQGLSWALSGRLRSAVQDVERAIGIVGVNPRLQHLLGSLYVRGDRADEGEAVYRQLLEENPDDIEALAALFRSSLVRGDVVAARGYWEDLSGRRILPERLVPERATLKILENRTMDALRLLRDHLRTHQEDGRSWGMLILLAQQEGQEELLTASLAQLQRLGDESPDLLQVMAQAQLNLGYLPAARETLTRILRQRPSNVAALEMSLRLDVMEGNQDSATRNVERLLSVDPGNPLGNYILGTLQVSRRDFALAEVSMRRSLQRQELPEALNDLAWLLQHRGATDEAYPLIQRALELSPRNANAWSTYGVILLNKDRIDDASEALHQAIQLQPDNPLIQLNLVELYYRMNMPQDALMLLDNVMAVISLLPEDDRDRAMALSVRLRSE